MGFSKDIGCELSARGRTQLKYALGSMLTVLAAAAPVTAYELPTRDDDGLVVHAADRPQFGPISFAPRQPGFNAFARRGVSIYRANDSQSVDDVFYAAEGTGPSPGSQSDATAKCEYARSNPIIISNANKIEREFGFYSADAEMPLSFALVYNRNAGSNAGTILNGSWNWNSSIDYFLFRDSNDRRIELFLPDGRQLAYQKDSDGVWRNGSSPAYVTLGADGVLSHHTENGWVERFEPRGHWQENRIKSISNRQGIAWQFAYRSDGSLASVTHSSGKRMGFQWTGNVLTVTDPAGGVYRYSFSSDTSRQLASVSYPDGGTVQYHYETPAGQLPALAGKSYNGVRYSTFTYGKVNGWTLPVRSEHAGGVERSSFAYTLDEQGAVSTVVETNPLGRQTTYEFAAGKLLRATGHPSANCGGAISEMTYDVHGHDDKVRDFAGVVTDYDYDEHGHLQKKVVGAGTSVARSTTYGWDEANNRLTRVTTVGDHEIEYTYTPDHRLATQTVRNLSRAGAIGQTRRTTYAYTKHASGVLATIAVDGPLGKDTATTSYSASGNLLSVTDGLGHTTVYSNHNGLGLPGRITGPNGDITEYGYDARGRVTTYTTIVNGVASVTNLVYDKAGRLISERKPDGVTTTYAYDAAGRLLRQWRPEGGGTHALTRYSYNANSQVTSIVTERTTKVEELPPPVKPPVAIPATPQGLSLPAVNETGSYTVQWSAATSATTYRLEESANGGAWTSVHDGAATSATLSSKTTSLPYAYRVRACNDGGCSATSVPVTIDPIRYGAQFVGQSVPSAMAVGQSYAVSVQLKNTGNVSWTDTKGYRLGSQNPGDNNRWGIGRVAVHGTVAPGDTATFTFNVVAPAAGSHAFQWRMVRDGVIWFGDSTPSVAVTTLSGAISASPSPCTIPGGGSTCTSTVNWSTSHGGAEVWVTNLDGSGLQLFHGNTQNGSASAPWIPAQGKRFHLKRSGFTLATVDVRGQLESRASRFLWQSVPNRMVAGQWYEAWVGMRNTGGATWNTTTGFNLGSRWPHDNTRWGMSRVGVPGNWGSQQDGAFHFWVRAPDQPGIHNFEWQMVQEGVTWFGDTTPYVQVTVMNGWISSSPNPCTIPWGRSTCTVSISWGASHAGAEVWVTDLNNNGAQLFHGNTQNGSASAPWIAASGNRFHLKKDGLTLATVDVRGNPTTQPPPEPPAWKPPPGCRNCSEP
ncbi:hypothetical protein [Lysobacter sp. GCM10012299]|uniref:hypothetical protein n=1 Tax=Lysobacter sp. GCM10012299 TaxID=3317333 RepID=UPI003606B1F4